MVMKAMPAAEARDARRGSSRLPERGADRQLLQVLERGGQRAGAQHLGQLVGLLRR